MTVFWKVGRNQTHRWILINAGPQLHTTSTTTTIRAKRMKRRRIKQQRPCIVVLREVAESILQPAELLGLLMCNIEDALVETCPRALLYVVAVPGGTLLRVSRKVIDQRLLGVDQSS